IAAHWALDQGLARRVLIMDWDVHHGNGTQHAFWEDPRVLFISTHRYPFYPGTGDVNEVGKGAGEGYTVNIPLPGGTDDAAYLRVFRELVDPIARRFEPDLVLISAGFDAHERDPLGGMAVTEPGFGAMMTILGRIADDHAGGRAVAVLEGGYDLLALERSVARVLLAMGGEEQPAEGLEGDEESVSAVIQKVKTRIAPYWKL
ncbi:MAG: histone deacetylase, partial [Candidatus Methylomirabilis sp.]|nr:histone deacetylase [Deltaproteobacteria bacterium]